MPAVLWEFAEGGSDRCVLESRDAGFGLRGTALLVHDRAPVEIRYAVGADREWRTTEVDVVVELPGGEQRRPLGLGELWRGGERPPEFRDCVDVDLGFTPATNTLPIRRLGLGVGERAEIAVAWLRWPELTVERLEQRYERLAADRYLYGSGAFEAELTVDAHGLVLDYRGLWGVVARA